MDSRTEATTAIPSAYPLSGNALFPKFSIFSQTQARVSSLLPRKASVGVMQDPLATAS